MSVKKKPKQIGGDLARHPDAHTISGKVDDTVEKQITALPFVRNRKRGEKGHRCFWSVKPTGDYSVDYQQGVAWVRLVLPLLRYNVGPVLVSWIVADMIAAGERNGLVLGFARGLADALQGARQMVLLTSAFAGPAVKVPGMSRARRAALQKIMKPKIQDAIRDSYLDAI